MLTNSVVEPHEGIRLAHGADNLVADIIRVDKTTFTRHDTTLDRAIEKIVHGESFAIVDENLLRARPDVADALPPARCLVFPSGEASKTLATVEQIITEMYSREVHRLSTLVGLGGGVVTDVVGLVGCLYFRGVRVTYVPTTLLAMVDAAIGGKVAVNHPDQKNLIGAFNHPAEVHICLDALRTLPHRDLIAGLGEALKMAVVDSPSLFGKLERLTVFPMVDVPALETIIQECIERKLTLLGANCFERSLRRILNFGHSIAHPLEDVTNFRVRHGEAVAIGIMVACFISRRMGILDTDDLNRILSLALRLGLPIYDRDFPMDELVGRVERLILQRGGHALHYVVPERIGSVRILSSIAPGEVEAAFHDATAWLRQRGGCGHGSAPAPSDQRED